MTKLTASGAERPMPQGMPLNPFELELLPTKLVDNGTDWGIPHTVADLVDSVYEGWADFAETNGTLHWGAMDGQTLAIRRVNVYEDGQLTPPSPKSTIFSGLKRFWNSKVESSTPRGPKILKRKFYVAMGTDADQSVELQITDNRDLGFRQLSGHILPFNGEGAIPLRSGHDLEPAASRLIDMLCNAGLPRRPEDVAKKRQELQQYPSTVIEGEEAIAAQQTITALLGEYGLLESVFYHEGDSIAELEVASLTPVAIGELGVRAATIQVHPRGTKPRFGDQQGRLVTAQVGLTSNAETAEEWPMLVTMHAAYQPTTGEVTHAQIEYARGTRQDNLRLLLGPDQRESVHGAITQQLRRGTTVPFEKDKIAVRRPPRRLLPWRDSKK